jgi:hypothetical protein
MSVMKGVQAHAANTGSAIDQCSSTGGKRTLGGKRELNARAECESYRAVFLNQWYAYPWGASESYRAVFLNRCYAYLWGQASEVGGGGGDVNAPKWLNFWSKF